MRRHSILFVDDERSILSSLKRMFFDVDTYDLYFASSGKEALELMEERTISVVVSDMRMPEMDGTTLMKKIHEKYPDTVRMVLSAFSEMSLILDAVNDGHVWRYITKPWSELDLKVAVSNAVEHYEKKVQLAEMMEQIVKQNQLLEVRIAESTRHIKEINILLKMILEGTPFDDILSRVKRSFFENGKESSLELTICERGEMANASQLAPIHKFPLLFHNEELGDLCVEGNIPESVDLKEVEKSVIPLIALAKFHSDMNNDIPSLLSTIDDIVEDL